jgi:hypothetical protein
MWWQAANIETTPRIDEKLLCSLGLSLILNDPCLDQDSLGHHLTAEMIHIYIPISEPLDILAVGSLGVEVLTFLKRMSHLQA